MATEFNEVLSGYQPCQTLDVADSLRGLHLIKM